MYKPIVPGSTAEPLSSAHGKPDAETAALLMCRSRLGFRPLLDFATHQKQEQNPKHRVHAHEAQQRKHAISCRHHLGVSVRGTHETENQPALSPTFCLDPSGRVCYVVKLPS